MDQGKSTSDRTPIETAKPENQGLNTPLTSPCKQDPISELHVFNSGFQNFFSSHIHLYGTKLFNKGYAHCPLPLWCSKLATKKASQRSLQKRICHYDVSKLAIKKASQRSLQNDCYSKSHWLCCDLQLITVSMIPCRNKLLLSLACLYDYFRLDVTTDCL